MDLPDKYKNKGGDILRLGSVSLASDHVTQELKLPETPRSPVDPVDLVLSLSLREASEEQIAAALFNL